MIRRLLLVISAVLCTGTVGTGYAIRAQESGMDPSGYVLKYDREFDGIGPKVYVLPAPRTKKEMLMDTYKEITPFRDSIDKALRHQKFIATLIPTTNEANIQRLLDPVPTNQQAWDTLIRQSLDQGNLDLAYGLLNEQAKRAASNGDIPKAIKLLEQAEIYATSRQASEDIGILQANLSTLQFLNLNPAEAEKHEYAYYEQATKEKNTVDQALSLVRLASIQALDKNYISAENTIIRKAIPLFNRSKYFEGKVWAWETLADIYQAQNKHTEAQWFLIQARDLATAKNQDSELAEIEYMLAYSKFIQKNYKVAKTEFISAYNLAEKENNDLLKLAIVEKLGNIYLLQNNIELADKLLVEYWQLRTNLFESASSLALLQP